MGDENLKVCNQREQDASRIMRALSGAEPVKVGEYLVLSRYDDGGEKETLYRTPVGWSFEISLPAEPVPDYTIDVNSFPRFWDKNPRTEKA